MLNKTKIYLVSLNLNVGGCEKRFIRIWLDLQEKGWKNIQLILSKDLFKKILEIEELKDVIKFRENLFLLPHRKLKSNLPYLFKIFKKAGPNSIIHYLIVGIPLIHRFLKQRIIITFPSPRYDKANPRLGFKYNLLLMWTLYEAWKVDVLNPIAQTEIRKLPFINSSKIFLTPGSFVDFNIYKPDKEKKNWIVFLGAFTPKDTKNILKTVECIPFLYTYLQKKGIKEIRFFIMTHGPRAREIKSILKSSKYKNIPIECHYEPNPQKILSKSKVFLSLQKEDSNYPSKALLEALACGNLAIVTDVGESRLIAREPFSFLVNPNFKAEDLSHITFKIFTMPEEEFQSRINKGIDFIKSKFSIESSANYFLKMYELKKQEKGYNKEIN